MYSSKVVFLTKALRFPSDLSPLLLPSDTASEGGEQPLLIPHSVLTGGRVVFRLSETQPLHGKVVACCDEWFAGNLENCALYRVTELQSSALENSLNEAYSQGEAETETEGGLSQRQALAQPRQPNWPRFVLHMRKKHKLVWIGSCQRALNHVSTDEQASVQAPS